MEKKLSWLRDLVNFGGIIVGIVLTAIGGVMFLNSMLKVYVFGFETNSYFNAEEQCTMPEYAPTKTGEDPQLKVKPQSEIDECITKKTEYEKIRYSRQQKESMIDGFAFLLVGIVLWVIHHNKKKKSED